MDFEAMTNSVVALSPNNGVLSANEIGHDGLSRGVDARRQLRGSASAGASSSRAR